MIAGDILTELARLCWSHDANAHCFATRFGILQPCLVQQSGSVRDVAKTGARPAAEIAAARNTAIVARRYTLRILVRRPPPPARGGLDHADDVGGRVGDEDAVGRVDEDAGQ